MAARTPGTFDTVEVAMDTSSVRIRPVTSSPSTKVCCPSGVQATVTRSASHSAVSAASSSILTPRRRALSPTARYMAPVSRCRMPSRRATTSAIVDLPAPTGPSMAIVNGISLPSSPYSFLCVPRAGQMARWPMPMHTSLRCTSPMPKNTATATCSPPRATPILPPTDRPSAFPDT